MPDSLAAMLALFNDNTAGDISAADGRAVIQALYDWIPVTEKYKMGRLSGETAHADDDFFTAYSGYTEVLPDGTAAWGLSRFGLSCKFASQSANRLAATVKSITATGPPLTIETQWSVAIHFSNNPGFGICFTDGTAVGSKVVGFGFIANFGPFTPLGTINSGSATGATAPVDRVTFNQGVLTVRLVWKSANTWAWAISPDGGTTWTDYSATTIASTMTPTHFGVFVTGWAQSMPNIASFAYLRMYEADLSV